METNHKSNNGRKVVIIIIIAILLAANGILLWQFFTQKEQITTITTEKKTVIMERDELQKQKADLQMQLDSLVAMNSELTGKLKISEDSLAVLQARINSLQYVQSQYSDMKSQLEKLKAEMSSKMGEMATLQKENDALKSDKSDLTNNLNDEKSKEQKLAQDKDALASKVALGSVMRADNFKVSAVKFSKSGKESAVTSAKSTQKLKVCFTVEDNMIVDKGSKTIYVRVMGPDNKCITNNSQTFQSGSQNLPYSTNQDINYSNQKIDQCIYWAKGSTYKAGKYYCEVYIDGNLIGKSSSIVLK
jgi:hypothetical protein